MGNQTQNDRIDKIENLSVFTVIYMKLYQLIRFTHSGLNIAQLCNMLRIALIFTLFISHFPDVAFAAPLGTPDRNAFSNSSHPDVSVTALVSAALCQETEVAQALGTLTAPQNCVSTLAAMQTSEMSPGNSAQIYQFKEDLGDSREGGMYIVPNESNPEQFQDAYHSVNPGGTLISVGTFRTLIAAGLGDFGKIVFLDFDKTTTEFNKLHLALIQEMGNLPISPQAQRLQYFASLNCKWLSEAELGELSRIEGGSNASPSSSQLPTHPIANPTAWKNELLEQFDNSGLNGQSCNTGAFPPKIGAIIEKFKKLNFFSRVGFGFPETTRVGNGILWKLYKDNRNEHRPAFYWENDRDWKKIVTLEKNGKTTALVGNLVGHHAFISVGEYLKKEGDRVSVVDVSNATEILDPGYSAFELAHDPKTVLDSFEKLRQLNNRFIRNIQALPLDPQALLLSTARLGHIRPNTTTTVKQGEHWDYSWRLMPRMDDFYIHDWTGEVMPSAEKAPQYKLEELSPYFRPK